MSKSDRGYGKTWEGVPFDAPNGQPGWEGSAWAHPELLRRLEGQRGRLAGVEERLLKLEGELPSGTTAAQEARKVARLEKESLQALKSRTELDGRVKKLEDAFRAGLKPSVAAAQDGPTPELLQALRAAGVTRYQDGELVIELGPAAAPKPVLVGGGIYDPTKKCTDCGEPEPFHAISCSELPLPTDAQRRLADAQQRLDSGEDVTLQDDAPPDAPEPTESPSGFGVDHDALAAKLEERARAMGRAPE